MTCAHTFIAMPCVSPTTTSPFIVFQCLQVPTVSARMHVSCNWPKLPDKADGSESFSAVLCR